MTYSIPFVMVKCQQKEATIIIVMDGDGFDNLDVVCNFSGRAAIGKEGNGNMMAVMTKKKNKEQRMVSEKDHVGNNDNDDDDENTKDEKIEKITTILTATRRM